MEALGSSFDWMPRRCAVCTTAFGPTSSPSRTATVLSDSASAVRRLTGPR